MPELILNQKLTTPISKNLGGQAELGTTGPSRLPAGSSENAAGRLNLKSDAASLLHSGKQINAQVIVHHYVLVTVIRR